MAGKVVDQYASFPTNTNLSSPTNETMDSSNFTRLEVVTIISFLVGAWQIAMGVFRLGVVGIILSQHLVSGFTTAAAFHVLMSQIGNLLGIKVPRYGGAFRLVKSAYSIILVVPTANPAEIIISSITIICLAVYNDWIKPLYSKKFKIPIPLEMLLMAVGTTSSYFCLFNENYGVKVLGTIPTGIPTPSLPPFDLISDLMMDSLIIAIVVYALSLSMAKTFSRKCNYPIDNNQELLALGAANLVASFTSCIPVSGSPSRTLLQYATGGRSQIASFISCSLLFITLLWIGPIFEMLPLSVLSGVIVVTLKGLFMQFSDVKELLKISPLDAAVWIICFLATVFIDFKTGLGLGMIASVSVLIYRGHCPHHCILGRLPGTEFYVDVSEYPTAVVEPDIKIFRWVGAIHFANGETFRNILESLLPASQNNKILPGLDSRKKKGSTIEEGQVFISTKHLICDFTALSYIDLVGSNLLKALHKDFKSKDIKLSLVICSDHLIRQLECYQFFQDFPKTNVYPAIIDSIVLFKSYNGTDEPLDDEPLTGICSPLSADI